MAPTATALTTRVANGTPYQLDSAQTLKATGALLKHFKVVKKELDTKSTKRSLLTDLENEDDEANETHIWLSLTTKKHIVDAKRLKPGKITLPHSLHTSATSTICLITADPQRAYKDIVASPAFPSELAARIGRVIDVTKIKQKYGQYEAQRQLLSEYDVFLADDRIITLLPKLLGKTFYKATAKRPIPISMQPPAPRSDGKKIAKAKKTDGSAKETISPKNLAAEIEKTLGCALVNLSPSTSTSVRVGLAGWSAEDLAENVEVLTNELITRFVPQKWRGVRAIHIKGPETAALPIWLADELWADDADVLEDAPEGALAITGPESRRANNKRKAIEATSEGDKKEKKSKTLKLTESNDTNLDKEIALRKETLKKQKEKAIASVAEEILEAEPVKKAKKSKAVLA